MQHGIENAAGERPTADTQDRYYRHSGNLSILGLNLGGAAGVGAAVVLGAAYGYIIHYCPFVYLNFLVVLLYGGALGWVTGTVAKWGKVRSLGMLLLIGAMVGIAGVYTSWVSYIFAISGSQTVVFSPDAMFKVAEDLAQHGMWTIFGMTPTGSTLWIIWALEALMIVGASALFAIVPASDTPFCEDCDGWTTVEEDFIKLEVVEDETALQQALEAGDLAPLLELKREAVAQNGHTKIRVDVCRQCGVLICLSLTAATFEMNDDQEQEKVEHTFLTQLLMTPDEYSTLRARFGHQSSRT